MNFTVKFITLQRVLRSQRKAVGNRHTPGRVHLHANRRTHDRSTRRPGGCRDQFGSPRAQLPARGRYAGKL